MLAQQFTAPSVDWWALTPLLVLLGGGLLLLLIGALTPDWPRACYALAACATATAAAVIALIQWEQLEDGEGPRELLAGALRFDKFSLFLTVVLCIAVVGASLLTTDHLRRDAVDAPELYGLYLMSAIGGISMAMANDMIVLFLGLETLSIALYVLAASDRRRNDSLESGIKYFVLGGFASAFLLFGISLMYGATGHTNFTGIFAQLDTGAIPLGENKALLLAGLALLLVGLAFKVGAVPFHMWTPDVYQGSPSPVTAFMASAAKAAAFAAMIRVLTVALPNRSEDWKPVIWLLAIASLVIGSIMAAVQTNVKRMLAYSSIGHAGFILVGIQAATTSGTSASTFYLLAYTVMVIGTFGVVAAVGRAGDSAHELTDYEGLNQQHPVLAFALSVLLFAQAGIPVTSGFIAKFGVISAAVESESYALAIVAMVSAVIAAFLYLRITVSMYMKPGAAGVAKPFVGWPTWLAIGAAVAVTILLGVLPGWVLDLAKETAR